LLTQVENWPLKRVCARVCSMVTFSDDSPYMYTLYIIVLDWCRVTLVMQVLNSKLESSNILLLEYLPRLFNINRYK